MIPFDFEAINERIRRFICRLIKHRWLKDGGESSPIIPPIAVCGRCGKTERLLTP